MTPDGSSWPQRGPLGDGVGETERERLTVFTERSSFGRQIPSAAPTSNNETTISSPNISVISSRNGFLGIILFFYRTFYTTIVIFWCTVELIVSKEPCLFVCACANTVQNWKFPFGLLHFFHNNEPVLLCDEFRQCNVSPTVYFSSRSLMGRAMCSTVSRLVSDPTRGPRGYLGDS